jgi:hypothetical protein
VVIERSVDAAVAARPSARSFSDALAVRFVALIVGFVSVAGCGDESDPIDASVDAAADVGVDSSVDDFDASNDATIDGGARCECPAFERCEDDACVCDDDALCGTRGHAGFPMRAPSERSFRVDGDVVIDDVTGLSWQRESVSSRPWAEARAHCASLVSGGREDWRLPARVELATILDASRTPSFDASVFAGAADYVWTASRLSDVAAYAIYFGQGETVSAGIDVGGGHVRCVAGERAPVPRGTVDGDVVLHGGLGWERAVSEAITFSEATRACGEGARLPSLYELHDLVDEARARPAIDAELFPSTPSARFWSATERDFGEIVQWVVDFADGQTALLERGGIAHVRCVRDASAPAAR